MSLLNPGTLTEYSGPSRSSSRRSRGTVRVRDPAHGFFVAGSSLDALNGIYGRVRTEHVRFLSVRRPMRLAYRHDKTGWLMVLVDVDPEEIEEMCRDDEEDCWTRGYEQPCDMQWRFIDDKGVDRFRHKGDTIIPGAGTRWKHMKNAKEEEVKKKDSDSDSDDDSDDDCGGTGTNNTPKAPLMDVKLDDDGNAYIRGAPQSSDGAGGGEIVETKQEEDDDEDELPWQVIALLDRSVLEDLRFSSSCRDERVERALKGLDVEQPPESTIEGFLEAERRAVHAITDGGGGGCCESAAADQDDAGLAAAAAPKGWLYRVAAEDGVELFSAPASDDRDSDDGEEGMVVEDILPGRRKVGMRTKDDYVRVVEVRGRWLRLSPTERPLRDVPLAIGDTVRVISGHYRGETGEITRDLDPDTREFGVKLAGYTGTGTLHVSTLRRNGPMPGSKAARRAALVRKVEEERDRRAERRRRRQARERERLIMEQYYGDAYADFMPRYLDGDESEDDDSTEDEAERLAGRLFGGDEEDDGGGFDDTYDGPLWVAATEVAGTSRRGKRDPATTPGQSRSLLVRVSAGELASLTTGVEKEDADLYDRPFEPRIEGGETSQADVTNEVDSMDEDIEDANLEVPAMSSPLLVTTKPIPCAGGGRENVGDDTFPVGSFVLLHGLKNAEQYNGRCGTVISKCNADGRCGVRLDPPTESDTANVKTEMLEGGAKKLLLKIENISRVDQTSETDTSPLSSQLSPEEKSRALLSARVINVRLDSVGLGSTHVDLNSSRQILDALLRAADRDGNPHQLTTTTASSQRMMSDALEEAERAHAVLVNLVQKTAQHERTDDSRQSNPASDDEMFGMAPHLAVHDGFLGERARRAMVAASDTSSFERVEVGVTLMEAILKDEQARILRKQAGGGLVRSTNPTWKLEQAEMELAGSSADNTHEIVAGDCIRLRLAIVHALFNSQKDADAAKVAETTSKLYPHCSAAQLWHARCLLRQGHRSEAMQHFNNCVSLGPSVGPGGAWAHGEGVKRMRSLRRTLKCEYRAKDSYERGNFVTAATIYGEMLEEYDGYSSDDKWGRAEALIARAACHRRDRNLKAALADCDLALSIFPRYPRALFRRALCLLESQRPKDALGTFEQLLRVDRKWPKLLDWLVRAVAQARRLESNSGSPREDTSSFDEQGLASIGSEDYYAVLGVSTDATEAQLKRAYRLMSLKVHPDKKGGSSAAFHLVAAAYETLSDPEKRQLYDDGVDISKKKRKKGPYDDSSSESEDEDGNKKKSLREEVERKYFPENFKFWPFGDPFINKRRHQARKRKQAEQEQARKARMNGGRRPHPWWDGHDDWDL